MKFAAIVKKGIAFLICAALLTSDVMVTNATSVDTTEVSTELVREVNAASESVENTESVGKVKRINQRIQKKRLIQSNQQKA